MLATISQPFGEQIWILTSSNAKTAGNRDTQPFHAKSKMPSMSNITAFINLFSWCCKANDIFKCFNCKSDY